MSEENRTVDAPILNATSGVIVLTTLIAFVLSWMFFLGSVDAVDEDGNAAGVAGATAPEGFRGDAWFLPDDGMLGFVAIPAGRFTMGSDPSVDRMAYANERWSQNRRQGSVELPLYYITRFEVTVAQFGAFVEDSGYTRAGSDWQGRADHPVRNVSWTDALAYARWLQEKLSGSPETPDAIADRLQEGWRITLPHEAQWEKAARGTDGRIFPWGSRPRSDHANFDSNATVAVGSMECDACAYGLEDMSGNVWELTRSPFQPYPWDPTDNAETLGEDALWVMRGGSFSEPVNNVRAATRGGVDPGARRPNIGFRLVLSR